MKLTADTITDEQIRELQEEAWQIYAKTCRGLGYLPHGSGCLSISPDERREARARCAEILNARSGK